MPIEIWIGMRKDKQTAMAEMSVYFELEIATVL
jgi:hypothetical protein